MPANAEREAKVCAIKRERGEPKSFALMHFHGALLLLAAPDRSVQAKYSRQIILARRVSTEQTAASNSLHLQSVKYVCVCLTRTFCCVGRECVLGGPRLFFSYTETFNLSPPSVRRLVAGAGGKRQSLSLSLSLSLGRELKLMPL